MCGFAGFLSVKPAETTATNLLLQRMGDAIAHRGPDDSGIWCSAEGLAGFVHRRLSIVDLSPAGHQPMASAAGRYLLVFNGEIYNHQKLREELASLTAFSWRGHSDTETILQCFDAWGIEQTISKLVGMFAMAVWDTQQQELILVRDRAGEKPLYYGWNNGVFLFGSELKALKAHPAFSRDINRDALALYMQFSYVPTPYSIYQSVAKLPAGSLVRIKPDLNLVPTPVSYWQFDECPQQQGLQDTDEAVLLEQLHQLIKQSVAEQMVADVPLGAFLSGGIDSSLIVSVMQSISAQPVRTFTIGFTDEEFNEATHAAQVAAHLGTEHHELYLTPKDMLDVVPHLAKIYDEPFADSSQIPTYLVSRLARSKVTVALSGDAGDELFGGYSRYQHSLGLWQKFQQYPTLVRRVSGGIGKLLSPFQLNALAGLAGINTAGGNLGHRLAKLTDVAQSNDFSVFYRTMLQHTNSATQLVLHSKPLPTIFERMQTAPASLTSMMLFDSQSYLPDDILTKVDRASMAVSLESRIPLLDYRLIEFAQQLPLTMKVKNGQTKWCLRQLLDRYVPRTLIDRPKKGFGVPLAHWLRNELKTWAVDLLHPQTLHVQGYLDAELVGRMWAQHQNGVADWHFQLWNILMFQLWLRQEHAE